MNDKLTKSQTEAVLKALDDALEQGAWEESNFLRVIGKNLREIRDKLADEIANTAGKQKSALKSANKALLREGLQEIFVTLYSTDGSSLQSWERILANLPKQMISRPIYAEEINVKNLIKSKENKMNEAYVAIFINQEDILSLPLDKVAIDKLGKPMMTLKDRALTIENISRFVHLSGTYSYSKGRLIKDSQ